MIFSAPHSVRAFLVVLALALTPSLIHAQQTKAIEPCAPAQESKKIIAPAACDPPNSSRKLVDENIPDDREVLKMLEPYRSKVRELDTVIGRLEGELKKGRVPGAGSMGNFVADGLRSEASRRLKKPVLLTITNNGGMRRSSIPPGTLRVRDLWELLPFENALIVLDMTGAQVQRLLQGVLASGDAQSGARITYRQNPNERAEFISATFIDRDGKQARIDPNAVYSIVTIDYLYDLSSGSYGIFREARNMRPLGLTVRDAMISYVKSLNARGLPVRAAVDDRFKLVGPSAKAEEQK
jgi:2',3'-cyclic-nucleotide 2'-phosphodiesterase (5'-nucleotidase family)